MDSSVNLLNIDHTRVTNLKNNLKYYRTESASLNFEAVLAFLSTFDQFFYQFGDDKVAISMLEFVIQDIH